MHSVLTQFFFSGSSSSADTMQHLLKLWSWKCCQWIVLFPLLSLDPSMCTCKLPMEYVRQRAATKVSARQSGTASVFVKHLKKLPVVTFVCSHSGGSLHLFLHGCRLSCDQSTERTSLCGRSNPWQNRSKSGSDSWTLLGNHKPQCFQSAPVGHFDWRVKKKNLPIHSIKTIFVQTKLQISHFLAELLNI